jgi:uncharacterized protein (DUF58 family)
MKPGRSFWTVLILAVITTLGAIVVGELLFFRVMVLWLGVLVFTWGWTRLSLRGITLNRFSRDNRIESGDFLYETYEVTNDSSIWKAWIEVIDQSEIPYSTGSKILTGIGMRQKRSYSVHTQINQRGYYPLGPTILRSGDILGVFVIEKTVLSEQNILVTPTIIPVRFLEHPFGYLAGGKAYQRKSSEITPYASGVREYEAGDPLNKIHWPTTARTQKFMVKEFDQDPQADVYVILDLDKTVQWETETKVIPKRYWMLDKKKAPKINPSSMDYITSVAASISKYYLEQRYSVGAIWREDGWRFLAADRGDRQLLKLLEAMALLNGNGDLKLDCVIEFQSRHLPKGSLLWLVTPVASQELIQAAEQARMRGLAVKLAVLDSASFGAHHPVVSLDGMDHTIRLIHKSESLAEIQQELEGNPVF